MKSIIGALRRGDAKLNAAFALAAVVFFALACSFGGSSSGGKNVPAEYLGDWMGQDGTKISIRGDGTGEYHSSSVNISGGSVNVDENAKTLKISFIGLGKTLKIDEPPSANEMKLDGVVYRRTGGFAPSSTSSSTSNANAASSSNSNSGSSSSSGAVPSDAELQTLVKNTLTDFGKACAEGDFDDFHANDLAKPFREQFSAEDLRKTFDSFVQQKINVAPAIKNMQATFSPAPSVNEDGVLSVSGSYPTTPSETKFDLKYVKEGGQWKVLSIKVKVG